VYAGLKKWEKKLGRNLVLAFRKQQKREKKRKKKGNPKAPTEKAAAQ
jgi:hypothetical protein